MSDLIKRLENLKSLINGADWQSYAEEEIDEIIKSVSDLEDLVMELGERDV